MDPVERRQQSAADRSILAVVPSFAAPLLCSNDERPVGTNSAMKTNHDNHKRNTTSRRARRPLRPLLSINVADALHDRYERNTIKHGAQMAMG